MAEPTNPPQGTEPADPMPIQTQSLSGGVDKGTPISQPESGVVIQETAPQSEIPFDGFENLCVQATNLMISFESGGGVSDVDNAVASWNQTLEMLEGNDAYKPGVLDRLGVCYTMKFERIGDPSDINRSIELFLEAVLLVSEGDVNRLSLVINLAKSYSDRFSQLGDLADINLAISYLETVVLVAPEGHISETLGMFGLGKALNIRFQYMGNVTDIEKAIYYQTQALSRVSNSDPKRPGWLTNLGTSHRLLFQHLGNVEHIKKAIAFHTEGLSLLYPGHAREPYHMTNLGISLHCRFERLGNVEDISQAIFLLGQAVSLTAEGFSDRPARLNNLGAAYQSRFEILGDISDIESAITFLDQAVSLTPAGHTGIFGYLTNLGNAHLRRFLRTDDPKNIDQAISCHTQAVLLTPEGHIDRPGHLSHLGNSYWSRFQRLGGLNDLNQAIDLQTQAVEIMPEGHFDKSRWLSNLGLSHADRFRRLGNVTDIDNAVAYQIQALSLVPEDHPGRPGWLGNLGIAYHTRFSRLGAVSDVDQAILIHAQAVSLTPEGNIDKARWLTNLGISLSHRFHRLGNVADIDQAIAHLTRVLSLGPETHPNRPKWLDNLGSSHRDRFHCLGDVDDIEQAIAYQSQAVLLAPESHPDRPLWLSNLGDSYQRRFECLENIDDIDRAIYYHSQAVSDTPEGHADRPGRLHRLGSSHYHRFECLGEQINYDCSTKAFQESSNSSVGSASVRFRAACTWAKLLKKKDSASALPAYQRAMELLPLVVWLGNTFQHRYQDVLSLEGAVNDAAAAAADCGHCDIAVEWLEEGHSIVWKQVMNLRSPFDDIHTASPELASRLERVAWELDQAGQTQPASAQLDASHYTAEQEAQRHRALAQDWESLVNEVRSIPGFNNFLRPKSISQLVGAARSGPVVVINTHQVQCDAFILLPGHQNATRVPLPGLSLDKSTAAYNQLTNSLHDSRMRQGAERIPVFGETQEKGAFENVLGFLWSDIVKPILDHLQYVPQYNVDSLPHITWCTSGPLSLLPLHAAGLYSEDDLDAYIFKHAISSYAPTLSSLLAPSQPPGDFMGLLAVGQLDTPGQSILRGTEKELDHISQRFKDHCYTQLDGTDATTTAVLTGMESHSWVHLACHASQHPVTPGMSAFYLYDGPLKLSTIISKPLKHASFAFLSACQTALGDEKLPDEAVHLAAGMLVAGYKSVIATMWSIQDNEAPLVAEKVYDYMLQDGEVDSRRAAKALHLAVQCLRDEVGEKRFEVWVPYVHIGM